MGLLLHFAGLLVFAFSCLDFEKENSKVSVGISGSGGCFNQRSQRDFEV